MVLQEVDRTHLKRHIDFLESEFKDYKDFKDLTWNEYRDNSTKRRCVERWIENLINSSIDIAKLLLATKDMPIPQTYKETLEQLGLIKPFDTTFSRRLARWARLRNIIAHEYLDIRWRDIRGFLNECEPIFNELIKGVKEILKG